MHVLTVTANEDAPFMTEQMAALEDRGVSFSTVSVAGEVDADTARGPTDYVRTVPRVVREARNGYDLIHAHYGLTAPMALAQVRTPVVLSLWGSDVHGPVAPISRLAAPFCDAVVVMSAEMRDVLGRDCTVIPDGVDLETFRPEPQDGAKASVGWDDDEDACEVLFPYSPARDVKNYPRAERVVTVVDNLLERPVRLRTVSGVDHDAVPDYMNAADALLLTSHSEGSPNSVKEALACNLPVVAVDVGDVRERLAGVDPSYVAANDEELIQGLLAVLERDERSNGRAAAREVSIDRTADRMLEVYERVAGRVIETEAEAEVEVEAETDGENRRTESAAGLE
ncbi:glycosyltransferase [Natrinema salaciae]|uniref:Glycosyltransferase involved in cell wall bisynthesis n=1 Tax=Natrinema salaciae TaxID=1186196 RepID=A0A1H9ABY6_9EURY|nr:glycosyltransferase [Natrinema salaciae]SEP73943.1 Glycosyltransferase involved in cell wall bisynthesis [Natrinema salaciae]